MSRYIAANIRSFTVRQTTVHCFSSEECAAAGPYKATLRHKSLANNERSVLAPGAYLVMLLPMAI